MQITIFGASGKVGRLVVQEALGRGYSVRVLVHAHNPFAVNDQVSVVSGSVYSEPDLRQALQGSQAVICALGSWGTPGKDVLTAAMRQVPEIMKSLGISRIVTLTGAEALLAGECPVVWQRLTHFLAATLAGKILHDGEEHMKLLGRSGLEWTTVRSPVMTNGGTANYRLRVHWPWPWQTINRGAVARCLVDQLESEEYLRQAPVIYRR